MMNVLEHVRWGWVGGVCMRSPAHHRQGSRTVDILNVTPSFLWVSRFLLRGVFFAKRIMCRQAKGRGPRKQLMTSVSTYVARLPYSRSNCAEVIGNNEMSSTGVWKHKEAHRPDIDAGCILGGKMAFYDYFKISLAQTYCDPS